MKSSLCVKMTKNSTFILDKNNKVVNTFNFDHCFWSHDSFITNEDGIFVKDSVSSPYADQALLYKSLGKDILKNAVKGYNCCIFAYG